jgi:glycosyltransferase involved in cell wall biosynthesis
VGLAGLVRAAWRIRGLLRRERPDVVQSFLPRANIVSRVGNRRAGRPAAHLSSERSTDFRRAPRVRRLNRLTAGWTDLVLAASPFVRDVLVARDGIAREKIAILENGIDLAAVDAAAAADLRHAVPALGAGRLLVCSVGRFVPEKGFVHLVRAYARMRRRNEAQLVLVGEGPEESAVRAEVDALALAADVHFLGFRGDVFAVLKAVDAYVLSSVEEGSPMAVLEAMACGLPCVATDVSGVRELVDADAAEPAALVVPPAIDWSVALLGANGAGPSESERVGMMGEAMDRLVGDRALRRRLACAARSRVESRYTLDRVVDRLEAYYAGVRRG